MLEVVAAVLLPMLALLLLLLLPVMLQAPLVLLGLRLSLLLLPPGRWAHRTPPALGKAQPRTPEGRCLPAPPEATAAARAVAAVSVAHRQALLRLASHSMLEQPKTQRRRRPPSPWPACQSQESKSRTTVTKNTASW